MVSSIIDFITTFCKACVRTGVADPGGNLRDKNPGSEPQEKPALDLALKKSGPSI